MSELLFAVGHVVELLYLSRFIGAAFSILFLKEPEREQVQSEKSIKTEATSLKSLLQPIFFIPFLIIFISSFGLSAYETIYGLFLDRQFQFTAKDIAILLILSGVLGTVFQVFLFDGLTRKLGEINLIRVCIFVAAIMMVFMMNVSSFISILLVTLMVFWTFDLIRPALTTYLSKVAGQQQGYISGLNSSFTSVGNIVGPIIAGALFDYQAYSPYVFSLAVLLISLVIAMFWRQPKKLL